jgi:4-alpha-glucanotransferase
VNVEAPDACHFWISPIQTVSESEEGFERVYQGSQILALWNVKLDPAKPWTSETVLHVSKVHNS